MIDSAECSIPVADLLAAPYSLPWGSEVFAKVKATNIKGVSNFSDVGNGAVLITIPNAPSNFVNDAALTTGKDIALEWT